jgi:hypothetical protein
MDEKSGKENEAIVDQGRIVHEELEERTYEDRNRQKHKIGATVDLTLLDLDPKGFRLIHETFEKRTYKETPLKVDEPTWQYIEDTGRTGHLIHEIVIKRCYEEIKDDDA